MRCVRHSDLEPIMDLSIQKGPSQRPRRPPSGGVGAVEDRFPRIGQPRTHTSTRVGRRFVAPKVPTKGAPNAHPRPGPDGSTVRKKERKDRKSIHFWVRVSAIEMTSPSARGVPHGGHCYEGCSRPILPPRQAQNTHEYTFRTPVRCS